MKVENKLRIEPYIRSGITLTDSGTYLEYKIVDPSEAIKANAFYFNHDEWAQEYLTYCHRSDTFKDRWTTAMGNWDDKVVLDIGCGPGNILATLKGKPKLIIGVDVAPRSLELSGELGYVPLLADATNLPFVDGFADIVTLNATLHHCEDMAAILSEAARVVKPGGLLITDHDPQLSAWDFKGVARLLWNARTMIYRYAKRGFHKSEDQQHWGLACEIHHKPGHGVSTVFFRDILQPLGFAVEVYPHNHEVGSDVLSGKKGKAELKYRLGNLLSGRNPNSDSSALSLMCLARKHQDLAN